MFTRKFWRDAAERIISTAAQAALGALGTTALVGDVRWDVVAGTAALAAVASLLKALVARGNGDPNSASLVE